MVKISVGRTRPLSEDEENGLICSLSENALARLSKKKDAGLRSQSLYAYFLLSETVGCELFAGGGLAFEESGRPYFTNIDCDVSISHTNGYAACAVSEKKGTRVGVDVENTVPDEETIRKISARFFSASEQAELSQADDTGSAFLEIWTKKEALKKCLTNELTASPLPDTESTVGFRFITRNIGDGTVLSVCIPKNENAVGFITK